MSDKERSKDTGVDEVEEKFREIAITSPRTPESTSEGRVRDGASTNAQRHIDFHSPPSTSSQIEAGASFTSETEDGRWLKEHPWEGKKPDLNLKMARNIDMSKVYSVGKEYQTGKKVDLQKIWSDLPKFITKKKGTTSREDLDFLLGSTLYQMNLTEINTRPHIREIVDKKRCIEPKDQPLRASESDAKFKAFSLPNNEANPSQQNYCYLDCEYMLKMWLPEHRKGWFKCEEATSKGNRITETDDDKKNSRWIFTPSYRRAKIALLDWPEDKPENKIVTQDSTIRILVVRPSEFDDYVKYCGHKFPVISLPRDEIGAGYPRFWIQKIALRLKLNFIWMIDDSVEYFYVYDLDEETKNKQERHLSFGEGLQHIENSVNNPQDKKRPIAVMSPAMGGTPVQSAIAVYLNLKALESKDVFYRPELPTYEDAIFRYECERNDLEVVTDNRVYLHDHQWHDTGAGSPYVQDNPTTAAASRGRGKSVRGK